MKLALRFMTAIGPRTVIAETPDERTARAIVNAHLAQGEYAEICDPSSVLSVREIIALRKKKERRKPKKDEIMDMPHFTPVVQFKKRTK